MTDEQLREALKKAIHEGLGGNGWAYANYGGDELVSQADGLGNAANAAIALMRPVIRAQALEEAARVAEESVVQECCGNFDGDYGSLLECCGKPNVTPMYPDEIAAAIRNLINKDCGNG